MKLSVLVSVLFSLACHLQAREKVDLRILVWEGYAPQTFVTTFKESMEKKYNVELTIKVSYAE